MLTAKRRQEKQKLLQERRRLKEMCKTELEQAIIKKKQCDAKSLAIIKQLLEPNINHDWLLQNLQFLNKHHMEDVIEERTILKLCGYVLCSKPLTIVQQRYHISTRSNKVYDISQRKKFCSSLCYAASNYLLDQMLESPLWMRDIENVPVFKILPSSSIKCVLKDEIDIGYQCLRNDNIDNQKSTKSRENIIKPTKTDTLHEILSSEENTYNSHSMHDTNIKESIETEKISINTESQKLSNCEIDASRVHENPSNKDCESQESVKANHNIQKINIKLDYLKMENIRESKNIFHKHDTNTKNENVTCDKAQACDKRLLSHLDDIDNKNNKNQTLQSELDKICSSSTTVSSDSAIEQKKERNICKINEIQKCKQKEFNIKKLKEVKEQTDIYCNLVTRIEQNIKEWITKDTFNLLLGNKDEKNQLLKTFARQESYKKLCKKLDKLEIEEKLKDSAARGIRSFKVIPDFATLQEEGKKLELKVRAYYGGQLTYPLPEDSNEKSETKDNNEMSFPLNEAYAINAIRRQIFLKKLNTILLPLLNIFTNSANIFSIMNLGYTHNNERYSFINILVSTFALSAENIVFKSAEWTLIGLIIIQMLSLLDVNLQLLLRSKETSKDISMILALYKLDPNYLDRFVMEVMNNVNVQIKC